MMLCFIFSPLPDAAATPPSFLIFRRMHAEDTPLLLPLPPPCLSSCFTLMPRHRHHAAAT